MPPLREFLGCDEPLSSAIAADDARPGDRGPDRMLHVGPGGLRLWRCPRALSNEPIAGEVFNTFLWWEQGQNIRQMVAPYDTPALLIRSLDLLRSCYRNAYKIWCDRHYKDGAES